MYVKPLNSNYSKESRTRAPTIFVHMHVGGLKRLGRQAGCQEVSRCRTRGESEDSIAHRQWHML